MAVNPLLSLQTRAVDFGQAAGRFAQASQARKGREQQQEIVDLRKQQLDLERVRTAFEQQDAAMQRRIKNNAINSLRLNRILETGGQEAAMDFLQENKARNERMGLDSNDTEEAMELLQSGEIDKLNQHLENNIFIGESLGVIDPPKDDDTFTARNIILPDGKKVSGRTTPEGRIEIVNEQGEFERAPQGAQIISTSLQGSESDIGATKPEIRNFRELEAKMPVVERLQERIAEGLEADEFVGGVSGSTVRVFNSLRSQVSQLYNTFNEDKPADQRDAELSVDKYQDLFEDVTNVTTKVKSGILDLAYMTLKAKGEKRVSDQDIRLELQTFGLDTNDPEVIMNRVNEKVGDLHANYRTTAKGLGIEPQFDFQERALSSGVPEFSSEEDAQKAIREGDLSVGDEVIVNGKRFKVAE